MRLFCLWAALTANLLPLSLMAYADSSDPPLGACYLGYGKMLEAAQPRQLSLNAHISEFLYQPGGLEIAYSGSQQDGDVTTQSIRLVGLKHGTANTVLSYTTQTDDGGDPVFEPYSLAGWSGDGRYLLLNQQHYVKTPNTDSGYFAPNFVCIDIGGEPIHLSPIDLPLTDTVGLDLQEGVTHYWWSPDRTRILFAAKRHRKQGEVEVSSPAQVFCKVYDPKSDRLQNVSLGKDQAVRGWIDSEHLLIDDNPVSTEFKPSSNSHYMSEDISTGVTTEIPIPARMPALYSDFNFQRNDVLSPKAAYLRLDDEPHHIVDQQKVSAVDSHVLWVRRTQGPKLSSAALVGLTPGTDDPQAVWSPTGDQIAFVSHGDLFVTDLVFRDATAVEKYAAGEQLTCAEERDVVASNLKQVGLAMIQYCQDYDENFPPNDDWQEKIGPYLKDSSILSMGGHPVVYHTPADLELAKMDSPADTVLATTDLPCATVTLYADGHVKAIPKPGADTAPFQ